MQAKRKTYTKTYKKRPHAVTKKSKKAYYASARTVATVPKPRFRAPAQVVNYAMDPNNPFGDKAIVRLKFNYAGNFSGDSAQPSIDAGITLNDLSQIWIFSQSVSKGYLTYPKLFNRYRVTGVAVKFTTCSFRQTSPVPFIQYLLPYNSDEGAPTASMKLASTVKQQRFAKTAVTQSWANGGKETSVTAYFDIEALVGDRTARTDDAYTAITDTVGNPYNSPARQWFVRYGCTTMNELVATAADTFFWNMEMVYTVEYFAQKHEQQAV